MIVPLTELWLRRRRAVQEIELICKKSKDFTSKQEFRRSAMQSELNRLGALSKKFAGAKSAAEVADCLRSLDQLSTQLKKVWDQEAAIRRRLSDVDESSQELRRKASLVPGASLHGKAESTRASVEKLIKTIKKAKNAKLESDRLTDVEKLISELRAQIALAEEVRAALPDIEALIAAIPRDEVYLARGTEETYSEILTAETYGSLKKTSARGDYSRARNQIDTLQGLIFQLNLSAQAPADRGA